MITIFSSFSLVLAKSNNWNILLNKYETDRAVYSKPNITETVNLTVKYFMVKIDSTWSNDKRWNRNNEGYNCMSSQNYIKY